MDRSLERDKESLKTIKKQKQNNYFLEGISHNWERRTLLTCVVLIAEVA